MLITSAMSARAHSLKNQLGNDQIILGDYHEIPQFMLANGNLMVLPNPQSTSYAHQMLTLCLDNAIDTVYILDNEEAQLLSEARQLFAEYEIQINTNDI